MSLINLTVQHGRTLDEARRGLERAVHDIAGRFGGLVRRVEWGAERDRVKLTGAGFWVEMRVDARDVHATGDIGFLGGLLGGRLAPALEGILQQTFQRQLP